MLKRFMNWLLHRVQSLLGIRKGRRSGSSRASEASSTLRDRINHLSQQTKQSDLIDSTIPVAARDSLSLFTEPLAEPADDPSSPVKDPTEPVAAAEKNVGRPIDSAATALSDAISVKPTFPTEVSKLMGSPSSDAASNAANNESASKSASESVSHSISANPSLRTLKKIPDDQLPAIHDLLPAVEASPDELAPRPSEVFTAASDQAELTPFLEPADSSLLAFKQSASEQAVLFSFDIVESQEPAAESPSATNSVSELLKPELKISKDVSDESNSGYTGELPVPPARMLTQNEMLSKLPKATILTDLDLAQEAIDSKSSESGVETDSEPLESLIAQPAYALQPIEDLREPTASTETLPYPWLLPSPEAALKVESETSQLVKTANEERPVKNGVVKLLFTLKEGNFHGYVAPDDGTKDILFHQKYINADIFSQLERGVKVTVSVKYVEGKAYATHVELL